MAFVCRGMLLAAILALTGWMLAPNRVLGWSASGHRVVANIAYDQLDPKVRAKIVQVIREHEDWDLGFEKLMPGAIRAGNAEDQERWIFLQAAIWPDLVRSVQIKGTHHNPKFRHDSWHFVNFPFYPFDGDEKALKGEINPNLKDALPATITDVNIKSFNCMQAFRLAVREIADSHSTKPEKALYYCWILHIGGDVHQPLHSTSLITRGRFNRSFGDTGGHLPIVSLGVNPKKKIDNLHAFWDGQHGELQDESHDLAQIVKRSGMILGDDSNVKAAEKAKKTLDIKSWVMESHNIAKESVYTDEVLTVVRKGEPNFPQALDRIDLSAKYQEQAQGIANRRVAEAGYRLAEILKQLD